MDEKKQLQTRQTSRYLADTLILLLLPTLVACFRYGLRPMVMSVFCIVTAGLCNILCSCFTKRFYLEDYLFGAITGWGLALLMPASAPYWLPMLGVVFSVLVVQFPFGSVANLPFAPLAAAYAFLSVCFQDLVYSYPLAGFTPALWGVPESGAAVTAAKMLKKTSYVYYDVADIFSGDVVGPVGATCFALLLASLLFLLIRNTKGFVTAGSFIMMCALVALLFPRFSGGALPSVLLELSSGSLMFFAVFAFSIPSLLPPTFLGQMIFGVFSGVICMAMRHIGVFEEGACFALLIMNAFMKLPASRKLLSQLS